MESKYWSGSECPDCGAGLGELHHPQCDVVDCTACGRQRLSCILYGSECDSHDPHAAAWDGFWPGTREAAAKGWFSKMDIGKGWVSCSVDDPGASPDLNRWSVYSQTGKDSLYK